MRQRVRFAPPYSLVLIGYPTVAGVPMRMAGSLVAATDSCVAVGVRSAPDGETEFTLGREDEVNPGFEAAFEAVLKTPAKRVAIRSVTGEILVESQVPGEETFVRVWVNDDNEPDDVAVGVG